MNDRTGLVQKAAFATSRLAISSTRHVIRSSKGHAVKILFVLTSHDTIEPAGGKTGLWYEELAAPYDLLKDAGAEVVMASPKGGRSPIDPLSQGENFQSRYNLTGLLDRAEWEATAWQRPWVAGRPDPVS